MTFHILGIIIPSDSYFSEGLKPPTRVGGFITPITIIMPRYLIQLVVLLLQYTPITMAPEDVYNWLVVWNIWDVILPMDFHSIIFQDLHKTHHQPVFHWQKLLKLIVL